MPPPPEFRIGIFLGFVPLKSGKYRAPTPSVPIRRLIGGYVPLYYGRVVPHHLWEIWETHWRM